LGEAVALTALLGAALKFEGKFILQASTDGPVDLLVADYQVPGQLRGYARFSAERVAAVSGNGDLPHLLGQGHFAMTIDRGTESERYQGVVPLEGESLTEAADTYFRQSEQLPTYIRLPVAKHYRAGQAGGPPRTWGAGGVLAAGNGRAGPACCSWRSSPARVATAPRSAASRKKIGCGPGRSPRPSRIT